MRGCTGAATSVGGGGGHHRRRGEVTVCCGLHAMQYTPQTKNTHPPTWQSLGLSIGFLLNQDLSGRNQWLRMEFHFVFLLSDLVLFSVSSTGFCQGFWFITLFRRSTLHRDRCECSHTAQDSFHPCAVNVFLVCPSPSPLPENRVHTRAVCSALFPCTWWRQRVGGCTRERDGARLLHPSPPLQGPLLHQCNTGGKAFWSSRPCPHLRVFTPGTGNR